MVHPVLRRLTKADRALAREQFRQFVQSELCDWTRGDLRRYRSNLWWLQAHLRGQGTRIDGEILIGLVPGRIADAGQGEGRVPGQGGRLIVAVTTHRVLLAAPEGVGELEPPKVKALAHDAANFDRIPNLVGIATEPGDGRPAALMYVRYARRHAGAARSLTVAFGTLQGERLWYQPERFREWLHGASEAGAHASSEGL